MLNEFRILGGGAVPPACVKVATSLEGYVLSKWMPQSDRAALEKGNWA